MQTELNGEVTRLAACWQITRTDGQVFAYADHDLDLTFGGVTYKAAPGFTRSAIRQSSNMTVDNAQVLGVIDDDSITEADLIAGKFDQAAIQIYIAKWDDLTVPPIEWFAGNIGDIPKGAINFTATLAGLGDALQDMIGKVYQPTCRHDLGNLHSYSVIAGVLTQGAAAANGIGCAANLATLAQNGTVTAVTDPSRKFTASGLSGFGPRDVSYTATTIHFNAPNLIKDSANGFISAGFQNLDQIEVSGSLYNDGTFNLKALAAGLMTIQGGQDPKGDGKLITSPSGPSTTITTEAPGYFDFGLVYWLTGANAGLVMEVKTWDGTSALKLLFQMPNAIAIGDTFIVTPGCSKRLPACLYFGQILNRDAEDFVKGEDAALQYANAQ
jgi:hypothetical protein